MIRYLPLIKEAAPYRQSVRIEGQTFAFYLQYNAEEDFFTVDLYRGDEVLAYGEKLVFGRPLFAAYADERFPKAALVPLDFSGRADAVTWETLGKSVLVYIVSLEVLASVRA